MPIPTRLANDGWWLCERPSDGAGSQFFLQTGSAIMADFSSPAPAAVSVQENIFPVKPAIAVVLAALADWLFYDQRIGISAVVFALALICGSVLVNLATLEQQQTLLAGLVVLAGLLPAVEEFNTVSLIFIASVARRWPLLTTNRKFERIGQRAPACATSICSVHSDFSGTPRRVQSAGMLAALPCGSFPWSSAASSYFCSCRPIR